MGPVQLTLRWQKDSHFVTTEYSLKKAMAVLAPKEW